MDGCGVGCNNTVSHTNLTCVQMNDKNSLCLMSLDEMSFVYRVSDRLNTCSVNTLQVFPFGKSESAPLTPYTALLLALSLLPAAGLRYSGVVVAHGLLSSTQRCI